MCEPTLRSPEVLLLLHDRVSRTTSSPAVSEQIKKPDREKCEGTEMSGRWMGDGEPWLLMEKSTEHKEKSRFDATIQTFVVAEPPSQPTGKTNGGNVSVVSTNQTKVHQSLQRNVFSNQLVQKTL